MDSRIGIAPILTQAQFYNLGRLILITVSQAAPVQATSATGPCTPPATGKLGAEGPRHWAPLFRFGKAALAPCGSQGSPTSQRPTRSAHPRLVKYATLKPLRHDRSAGIIPHRELPHTATGPCPLPTYGITASRAWRSHQSRGLQCSAPQTLSATAVAALSYLH